MPGIRTQSQRQDGPGGYEDDEPNGSALPKGFCDDAWKPRMPPLGR